ncbi:hypothetical protein EIP86_008844 [Pleurotus ostreatoroseus]|nr:hypothetical protein EIP86_008844 [Pleurotus ostreatoroseus]
MPPYAFTDAEIAYLQQLALSDMTRQLLDTIPPDLDLDLDDADPDADADADTTTKTKPKKKKKKINQGNVLKTIARYMHAELNKKYPPAQRTEEETRSDFERRCKVARIPGVQMRRIKKESESEFRSRIGRRPDSVYSWVRKYVSPNSVANLASDTSMINTLIEKKKPPRKRTVTPFALFLVAQRGNIPGVMDADGKSCIGEWMKIARQAYEDLDSDEKSKYEDEAREANETTQQSQSEEDTPVNRCFLAAKLPSHVQACLDTYSKNIGFEGFSVMYGVDEHNELVAQTYCSPGVDASGENLLDALLTHLGWNKRHWDLFVIQYVHKVFNPYPDGLPPAAEPPYPVPSAQTSAERHARHLAASQATMAGVASVVVEPSIKHPATSCESTVIYKPAEGTDDPGQKDGQSDALDHRSNPVQVVDKGLEAREALDDPASAQVLDTVDEDQVTQDCPVHHVGDDTRAIAGVERSHNAGAPENYYTTYLPADEGARTVTADTDGLFSQVLSTSMTEDPPSTDEDTSSLHMLATLATEEAQSPTVDTGAPPSSFAAEAPHFTRTDTDVPSPQSRSACSAEGGQLHTSHPTLLPATVSSSGHVSFDAVRDVVQQLVAQDPALAERLLQTRTPRNSSVEPDTVATVSEKRPSRKRKAPSPEGNEPTPDQRVVRRKPERAGGGTRRPSTARRPKPPPQPREDEMIQAGGRPQRERKRSMKATDNE